MTYPEVIEFLRLERLRRRIKQTDMSEIAGLDANTFSRLENFRGKDYKTPNVSCLAVTLFIWVDVLGFEITLVPKKGGPYDFGKRERK